MKARAIQNTPDPIGPWITPGKADRELGLPIGTVAEWREAGILPGYLTNGRMIDLAGLTIHLQRECWKGGAA
ncbi:MAG: hypothetical protein ACLFUJ_07105 [Phycisphaerae bacterium]